MAQLRKNAVRDYRRRLKRKGAVRVEVHVSREDAPLIRGIVRALADPIEAVETRRTLRERFGLAQRTGLKRLLASAPLEGIDLTRDHDFGRDVEL
jgi:hypothetical protein